MSEQRWQRGWLFRLWMLFTAVWCLGWFFGAQSLPSPPYDDGDAPWAALAMIGPPIAVLVLGYGGIWASDRFGKGRAR